MSALQSGDGGLDKQQVHIYPYIILFENKGLLWDYREESSNLSTVTKMRSQLRTLKSTCLVGPQVEIADVKDMLNAKRPGLLGDLTLKIGGSS